MLKKLVVANLCFVGRISLSVIRHNRGTILRTTHPLPAHKYPSPLFLYIF